MMHGVSGPQSRQMIRQIGALGRRRVFLPGLCLCAAFLLGCVGEMQDPSVQLHLAPPEIKGSTVSVNGGVVSPVERIQWEWGDGQADRHLFFPARHTYARPGSYEITVTAFTQNNTTASKSVSVEVK